MDYEFKKRKASFGVKRKKYNKISEKHKQELIDKVIFQNRLIKAVIFFLINFLFSSEM